MTAGRNPGFLITASLVVVGLALAWMIYQLLAGSSASDYVPVLASTSAPRVAQLPPEPTFTMPGLGQFEAILARPLFAPSRRPIRGSTANVVVSQTLGLLLMGVIISSADKFALVAPNEGGSPFRLREGEDYQGWILAEIENSGVTFRQARRREYLELLYETAPKPPVRKKKRRRQKQNVSRRLDPAPSQKNQGRTDNNVIDDQSDPGETEDD